MKKIVCECGKKIRVYEKTLGKHGKCPRCNRVIAISAHIWKSAPETHQINEYAVIREISRGHIGIVYEVIDKDEKRFAIKIAYSENENEMLQREYNMLKDISHKNIICYHQINTYNKRKFVVMDFIDGKSLQDILLGLPKQLPIFICLQIAQRLAKTLGYLHDKNIIHCNIKPSNILFTSHYELVVINFSIAQNINKILEIPAEFGGSPRHTSPEQRLRCKAQPQNDIYSLGCVLFELLTGESIVCNEDLLKSQHLFHASPHEINVTIPQEINSICRKAIHQEIDYRYSSTTQLVYEIENYIGSSCESLALQLQKFFNEVTFEEPLQSLNPQVTVENEFAHFRILQYFRRDYYGVTYKALDTHSNKIITLKVLLNTKENNSENFRSSIGSVKKIHHPYIAQITSYGVSPQKHYATEYIWGQPLTKLIGTHKYKKLAKIFYKIALALDFVHEKGICCGLHPESIFIDENLNPKIFDINLRSIYEKESMLVDNILCYTSSHTIEQNSVTPQDDIYTFGAILYNVLTKRPPFEGKNSTVITQINRGKPIYLRQINPDIPTDLEYICMKCLNKDTNKRYITTSSLIFDLKKVIDGDIVPRAKKSANSAKSLLFISSCIIAIIISLFVYLRFYQNMKKTNFLQKQLSDTLIKNARIFYQQKQWKYAKYLSLKALKLEKPGVVSIAKNIFHKSYLNSHVKWRNSHSTQEAKFSPSGNTIAFVSGQRVFVVNSQNGNTIAQHKFIQKIDHFMFNDEKECLFFFANGDYQRWNYITDHISKKYHFPSPVLAVGGQIIARQVNDQFCLFDLRNGKEIACWDGNGEDVIISSTGRIVAFRNEKKVEVWRINNQTRIFSKDSHFKIAISDKILAQYYNNDIFLHSLESDKEFKNIYVENLIDVSFSKNSELLLLRTIQGIQIYNISLQFMEHSFQNANICVYHPHKKELVLMEKNISYLDYNSFLFFKTPPNRKMPTKNKLFPKNIQAFHPHMKLYVLSPNKELAIVVEDNIIFIWKAQQKHPSISISNFALGQKIKNCMWISQSNFIIKHSGIGVSIDLQNLQQTPFSFSQIKSFTVK